MLATKIPFLDRSLVEVLGQGFAGSVPATIAAAKNYATDLLTIDTATLNGLTDLGALASGLQSQFNSAAAGSPFRVTAGIHDWSELRLEISFDAARSFALAPSLSGEVTAALASAGFELSAFSNLNVQTRLGGSLEVGIRLDGLNSVNGVAGLADRGFLRVNPLTVSVDTQATNLTASAGLSAQVFGSAATVNVVGGTVNLQARAELSLDPNAADGSGRFDLAAISATPSIRLQASGSLDARLPLGVTLGSFDLSQYGTPTLILATDSLFVYQEGGLLVTTPAVSLDVAVNADLAAQLLDLIGQVRDLGKKLPFDLFDKQIPGLGQSLNQILTNSQSTVEDGGLNGVFQLKDAVGHYFYSDYSSATGTGSTLNFGATIRGLLETLNQALAGLTRVKFSFGSTDWSGKNLAGFDFSAFRIAGNFSLDFLRGFNFSGADLRGVNFSGLDLTGIDFSGARFDGWSIFSGSILRGINFSGADLRGVNFSGLDLRWANFRGGLDRRREFQFRGGLRRQLVERPVFARQPAEPGQSAFELRPHEPVRRFRIGGLEAAFLRARPVRIHVEELEPLRPFGIGLFRNQSVRIQLQRREPPRRLLPWLDFERRRFQRRVRLECELGDAGQFAGRQHLEPVQQLFASQLGFVDRLRQALRIRLRFFRFRLFGLGPVRPRLQRLHAHRRQF